MPDLECPHGLDPAWCTICKQQASGAPPAGVRRLATSPAASKRAMPRSTSAGAPRAARAARAAPRPAGAAIERAPTTPAKALSGLRRVLFHAAPLGSWPMIAERGLRPAAALAAEVGHPGLVRIREDKLVLGTPPAQVTLRDQQALVHAGIEGHLDGVTLAGWLTLLNERAFLFARQEDLNRFLAKYKTREGQDLVVFDTARLLASAGDRVEVTTVAPSSPTGHGRCPCRGRATFIPLAAYGGDVADIHDVTVVGGLDGLLDLVTRVIRHHHDRDPEVLLPASGS